jgi:hypothetical protein
MDLLVAEIFVPPGNEVPILKPPAPPPPPELLQNMEIELDPDPPPPATSYIINIT